ncbi:butyrophilin subfamily 1 member A1-like [Symphorus nematophorus]
MHVPLVVAAALLSCYAGEALGGNVSSVILASVGDTVILPCSTHVSGDHPIIEWSKEGLKRGFALVYRDGCEIHEEKNPIFRYRTNLMMNELKNGNISLRISDVQLSDAGKYKCKTIRQKTHKDVMMELSVGAVSEPKLSIVAVEGGGVTLQCEANCWFPEPNITFHDDKGNNIDAENQKTRPDCSGRFTVTRRMTVQTHTGGTICRVHQPKINQTRETEIYIPAECIKSCTPVIIIVTAVEVTVFLALIAIIIYKTGIYKKCGKSGLGQKPPVSERNHQDSRNATIEELLRKIDELKLSRPDEEKNIRLLIEKLNDLCHRGQPATGNSPSRSVSNPIYPPPKQIPHHNNPKPAASTNSSLPKSGNPHQNKGPNPAVSVQNASPAPPIQRSSAALSGDDTAPPLSPSSAVTAVGGYYARSQSLSRPRANSVRPQRRNTISVTTNNRFSPLEKMQEDSEPLLE